MIDAEQALSLTGDIYDAALDPGRWPETLRKLAQFVGGVSSALASEDVSARKGRFYFSCGDDPHYTKLYFDKYIKLNPVLVPLMLLKAGEVRCASDFLPMEKLRTTRFYKEWSGPAGYGDNTVAVVEKSATVVTYLATPHSDREPPECNEARRRMSLLVPHIRRAVAIGRIIDMHRIEADVLADAVDALAAGVFLVREGGHVVRVNASGQAMLETGGMLCLDEGMLAACGASARRDLRETIASVVAGDLIVGPRGVAIPLVARNGERFVAHVLPLNSGRRRRAGLSYRAGAAVFVHKAEIGGLLPLEALASEFRFSPAELRVLVAVIEVGGNVPDIASVLGISAPTVRTHLRRLFEKTETRRQADLVKLVAGYSSPLLAPAELPA